MNALTMTAVLLAAVLLVSGVAKLRHPQQTRDAFDALRLPTALPQPLSARALPWAEIVLGVALLVVPAPVLVVVTGLVLGLMVSYLVIIVRALRFEEPVTCNCFGALGDHTVSSRTAWRNALLVLTSVVALVVALRGSSVPTAIMAFTPGDWGWLLVAVLTGALALLILGRSSGSSTPAVAAQGDDEELEDYLRMPIPFATLTTAEGTELTLRGMASTQARLLLWLNPGCGPCLRVGQKVDEWSAKLEPQVAVHGVYAFDPFASGRNLHHDTQHALLDQSGHTATLFGTGATPSAVLLGADGLMAGGPVIGEGDVLSFVQDIAESLGIDLDAPAHESPLIVTSTVEDADAPAHAHQHPHP